VNVDKRAENAAENAEGHQHPATAVDEIPLVAVIAFRKSRPSGQPSFVLVDFLLGALLCWLSARSCAGLQRPAITFQRALNSNPDIR
jgi:hypothetical protein